MSTSLSDGGLSITPQMNQILDKPGFISIGMGSERLRNMFQMQYAKFNPNQVSPFALLCMCGSYDEVKQAVQSGIAPDLSTTQTPFRFGFVSFTVLGALRLRPISPNTPMRHLDVIDYLIASGASPETPDIAGNTALHHASNPPKGRPEIAKRLLEKGANVNAQNRFGEVPLLWSFQGPDIPLVNILMEHGADFDIADGNGNTPRGLCISYGAEVTAAVQRWERKRRGEVAPMEEKGCGNCKIKASGMKQCARCHIVRYCSPECQRAHWKTHKPGCKPFSAETTVTLKPNYGSPFVSETLSTADFARHMRGHATSTTLPFRPGLTRNETENKRMVIKIQIPFGPSSSNSLVDVVLGGLLIYNKKRDFSCTVQRASNPAAYDAIVQVVRSRGAGGAKAYFAAELKNADELVVKISEVLAEQPF